MSLPDWLDALLPGEAGLAWEQVARLLPPQAYLAEPADLDELEQSLRSRGPFAVTQRAAGTLNGVFGTTRLQFLQVYLERSQRRLEPTTLVAGLPVAGLGDLLAMKLNAIAGRAQLAARICPKRRARSTAAWNLAGDCPELCVDSCGLITLA